MRFGTGVALMVGPLAALDRLATTTTPADQCRGGQRRSDPSGRAGYGRASQIPIRKDERCFLSS